MSQQKGITRRGKIFWLAFTLAGKRHRLSLETQDLAEAITKSRMIRAYPERYLNREHGDILEMFIDHQRRRQISQARLDLCRTVLTELRKHAGGKLENLTRSAAARWQQVLTARIQPKSVRDYLGAASVFYRWAVDARHCKESPVALLIPPKIRPKPRRVFLLPEQALMVLDNCQDQELKFALYCALHCGLRRGEIIASRPHWFDLVGGSVHVQNETDWLTKDRDNRSIPLTAEFKEFLKTYGIRSPYMLRPEILPNPASTYRYRTDFARGFNAYMDRLGLGHVTFHDLRRTFASLHASRGTPLYHICKWLGDDISVVEKTYAHLLPNDDRINDPWTQARKAAQSPDKSKAKRKKQKD